MRAGKSQKANTEKHQHIRFKLQGIPEKMLFDENIYGIGSCNSWITMFSRFCETENILLFSLTVLAALPVISKTE